MMDEFWHESLDEQFSRLQSGPNGLSQEEAAARLRTYGLNSLKPPQKGKALRLFLSQFKSPLILLLVGAAILSFSLGNALDASMILGIVAVSGLLGFFQERGAINALDELLALVEVKATVLRDGKEIEIPLNNVVPGDLLTFKSGSIIAADCLLLEKNHVHIDESTLTGESVPVGKIRGDPLFMGTVVASGKGTALVIATGRATEYGHITERARFKPPETAFEVGVRKFGFFLMGVTLLLVCAIFLINTFLNQPILESFMFSLALAVGLTPQLLPAIISVNLSHGARRMAKKQVIVKRLASIENFGQMDVLCSDKTGTVTVGHLSLERAVDLNGVESEEVARYAFLSAHFQSTYANPLDKAILEKLHFDVSNWHFTDEIPFDFDRRRLSVLFDQFIITKGAVPQILELCPDIDVAKYERYFVEMSALGFKSLAIAVGKEGKEENLTLVGFLLFLDPLKPDIAKTVHDLKLKGVQLKVITGDHHSVALHAANSMGMSHVHVATGDELKALSPEALKKAVKEKNVFAEIDPNEKEKIVLAIREAGHIVGYLGDGVNDVDALHSADVSIAVDGGADAAKETADIVLLQKDLSVLREGIEEGRLSFANTLKYVYMATSANFGNMFSMAGASLFLPFLPLLPKQVLFMNLMTDIPEMAIATDRVDYEVVHRPVKWNLRFIGKFMLTFGLISSVFDYLTFLVLIYFLKANESLFQTGWFVESVLSATLIVFAIRTRHALFQSRPSRLLTFSILAVAVATFFIPYFPFFGFVPLPPLFYFSLLPIVLLYLFSVEVAKRLFFRK
jgi:Mg2+-importing ATPase